MSQRLLSGLLAAAALGLAGILCAAPAAAIDLDVVKITPSVGYQGEFDDNIFRAKDNKKSDYINHILPALKIEATPGSSELEAHASADAMFYSRHTNFNFVDYTGGGSAKVNLNRLTLRAQEEWRHTNEFPPSDFTDRIPRDENTLGGGFDFDVASLWGVGFDYTWDYFHYLDGGYHYLSNNRHTFAPTVFYRLTGKTKLFAEFDFVNDFYYDDYTRSNEQYKGYLGIKGDVTDYFHVTAKAGWGGLHMKWTALPDQNAPMASIEAIYKPIDRLEVFWQLVNDFSFSTDPFNPMIQNLNTTLGLRYAITPKISLIPNATFGTSSYPNLAPGQTEKRFDYLYGGGLGLRYDIMKYVKFEAAYAFQARQSNYDANNYDDNRVFFTVTLSM